VKAASTDRTLILNGKIWTERLRIDHAVIFQASGPRISNAAALIVLAAGDLTEVIASVAADLMAATASAVVGLVVAIASVAEASTAAEGADGDKA